MIPANALIVDDEAHARVYARLLLQEVGIEKCWEAADGEAAIALFEQENPDLVLLDINLRMATGLEVLQRMNQVSPQKPVVILSSESAMRTVYEAERLGALAYILKYESKDDALATLREVLEFLNSPSETERTPIG